MVGDPSIVTDLEATPVNGIDDNGGGCNGRSIDRCNPENFRIMSLKSGWTDEKHDAYLDSLERSFVGQLYCSLTSGNQIHKGCRGDIRGTGAGGVCREPNQAKHVKEGQTKRESIESRWDWADEGRDSGSPSSLQHIPEPKHASPPCGEDNFPEHSGQNF